MVENTRKTLHTGTFKPVNLPEPLNMRENSCGFPVKLTGRHSEEVAAIETSWRIDDEWWRSEPVSRAYYAVMLASGKRMVVFKNLVDSHWYRQSY